MQVYESDPLPFPSPRFPEGFRVNANAGKTTKVVAAELSELARNVW